MIESLPLPVVSIGTTATMDSYAIVVLWKTVKKIEPAVDESRQAVQRFSRIEGPNPPSGQPRERKAEDENLESLTGFLPLSWGQTSGRIGGGKSKIKFKFLFSLFL